MTAEKSKLQPEHINKNKWVSLLERFIDSNELSREMLLALVERIEISGDLKFNIFYRFRDERSRMIELGNESEVCLHE